MSVGLRSAMPTMPARQPAFRSRRDLLVTRLATCITVLTAAIAVLIVAAAAVAFTITWYPVSPKADSSLNIELFPQAAEVQLTPEDRAVLEARVRVPRRNSAMCFVRGLV